MDRCALFVDAGYLLADGAMAVHGTRHREAVTWDYPGLLQLLTNLARERTGLPLLRCYWYEATVEGRRTPEHDVLADIPGLKLRLARIRPGRREGVDAQVHRDLMTLARNNAVADAVVVSGDEDLAQVVSDAQDLGIRVTVISIAADGSWSASRTLRQECDDLIEMSSGHLRPFVTLTTGADGIVTSQNGSRNTGALPAINGAQAALPPPAPAPAPPPPAAQPQSKGSHAAPRTPTPTYTYNPPLEAPQQPAPPPPPPPQPQYQGSHGSGGDRGGYRESNTGSFPAAQLGPYTGPQSAPVPTSHGGGTTTLADAVKAAHKEGHDFGDSIARDAPALWLEAVLARKPRMPSDLEARLLQGSSLPIDFLLHDEVRHALRRGFWDALERARR
ncbi:NYN domain-containing protein [Herbidospora sp. RD11066]